MHGVVLKFARDAGGATAIEYALISGLIAVFLIAALQGMGKMLSFEFSEVGGALK